MTAADDIIDNNGHGFDLAPDAHLEMAYEDSVAHPLVGSEAYNDSWIDASFDEAQEYAYEASLEEYDEEDE